MAAKLPSRDDLGPLPSASSERPIARVDTTAYGEGLAKMGQSLLQAGARLAADAKQEAERAEAYEVDRRLLTYARNQERALEESRRSMEAGGVGFADNWRRTYDDGARGVVEEATRAGLSHRALQALDLGLLRHSERLQTRALGHQLDEENRFAVSGLENSLATIYESVRSDPGGVANWREQGRRLVEAAPISPASRYTVMQRFLRQVEAEARTALALGITSSEDAARARIALLGGAAAALLPPRRGPRDRSTRIGGLPPTFAEPFSLTGRPPQMAGADGEPVIATTEPTTEAVPTGTVDDLPGGPFSATGRPLVPADGVSGAETTIIGGVGEAPASSVPVPIARRPGINDRGARPSQPTHIVIHHTGGTTVDSAETTHARTGYAYHYYILPDGSVEQRHDDGRVVYHAGTIDRVRTGVTNENSIGIAFVAEDDGAITDLQRATARRLIPQIAVQNRIPAANIWGHREVDAANPLTGRRVGGEGMIAREFREGRIALTGQGPEVPGVILTSAGAAPGAGSIHPVGSREWANVRLVQLGDDGLLRPLPVTTGSLLENSTGAQIRAAVRAVDAAEDRIVNQVNQIITRWETAALQGVLPPDAEVAAVRPYIERFPQLRANFEAMVGRAPTEADPQGVPGLAQFMNRLAQMPPDMIEARLNQEIERQRQRGASDLDIRRVERMRTLLNNVRTAINTDPNGHAQRVNLREVTSIPDAPFADRPINFGDSLMMQQHAAMARRVGQLYNQQPQFFSPAQRDHARDLLRLGGDQALGMLGSIVSNWGADAPLAMRQLVGAGQDGRINDPELAALGSMYLMARGYRQPPSAGGPAHGTDAYRARGPENPALMTAVRLAAREMHLRRTDPSYAATTQAYRPKPEEVADLAQRALGSAFLGRDATRSAVVAMADLLYMARARNIPGTAATFDTQLWQQGLNEVLGQTTERNNTYGGLYTQGGRGFMWQSGNEVVVPSHIRNDGLVRGIPTIMGALRIEDLVDQEYGLAPTDANGNQLTTADVRGARLVNAGGNRYYLAQGDPSTPGQARWVMDGRGQRYVLDLDALEHVIRQRAPQVYRGAIQPVPDPDSPARTRTLGLRARTPPMPVDAPAAQPPSTAPQAPVQDPY